MSTKPIRIAVLDDYQGVALEMADWSPLDGRAKITVFRDHLSDADAIVERLLPFDVVCVMRERTPLPRAIIERLPNLKLIASNAQRNASIDVAAARERNIIVCATGYSAHGAAEMTWALILALLRHVLDEVASVRAGGWQVAVGGDLHGRRMGIVGLGRIGGTIAKVAHAFGMHVVAWSQNLTEDAAAAQGAQWVQKEELFATADIVTVHLILSQRTRGIIGATEIGLMKRSAYLVNTSRGPLVDEAALIAALRERRIAGAGLDVYATEPLPQDHPFRTLDNLLPTGHVGFVTAETYRIFYRDTVDNILAWLAGEPKRVMTA